MDSNEMVMALLLLQTRFISMPTCIWCRKDHEVVARFRCYQCGRTLCENQIEHIPAIISQKLGVVAHDNQACGPVYDITNISPVERVMWFMRDNKLRKKSNG